MPRRPLAGSHGSGLSGLLKDALRIEEQVRGGDPAAGEHRWEAYTWELVHLGSEARSALTPLASCFVHL